MLDFFKFLNNIGVEYETIVDEKSERTVIRTFLIYLLNSIGGKSERFTCKSDFSGTMDDALR